MDDRSGLGEKKINAKEMNCNLEKVIDHIDHICQIAGNTLHVGIGSDLDGGYGREQCPYDVETIADLQTIPSLLHKRGLFRY
jgi:membrane dipeptidase